MKNRPTFVAGLERLGWERALVYKTLALTGLRKGELASLTVGQLELDEAVPYVVLAAADAKAGRGAEIALRADLADDIRSNLADRLATLQQQALARSESIPSSLPVDQPLFRIPADMIRVLDRDLDTAGIPKQDDRGRTVDIHAMRHTFATHMNKNGVAPRTVQHAMRHSTIDLTMSTYTDPRLLDIAGALDKLPALPIRRAKPGAAPGAIGTSSPPSLVPVLVPTSVQATDKLSSNVVGSREQGHVTSCSEAIASDADALSNDRKSRDVHRSHSKRVTRIELATFSLGS